MSLKGISVYREPLFYELKARGIEPDTPEAYKYLQCEYEQSKASNEKLNVRLTGLQWQRNFLAGLSVVLVVLCVFFAICLSGAPVPPPAEGPVAQSATRTSGKYVSSVSGTKYHRLSCQHAEKILDENSIYYETESEAEANGKSPCLVCKP